MVLQAGVGAVASLRKEGRLSRTCPTGFQETHQGQGKNEGSASSRSRPGSSWTFNSAALHLAQEVTSPFSASGPALLESRGPWPGHLCTGEPCSPRTEPSSVRLQAMGSSPPNRPDSGHCYYSSKKQTQRDRKSFPSLPDLSQASSPGKSDT